MTSAHPPTVTPQEALAIVRTVPVPVELFLKWIVAVGAIPSQFGAELYLGMQAILNPEIEKAAAKCSHVDNR